MKKNKIAGFWIRFLSRIIDLSLFGSISLLIGFLMLKKKDNWYFENPIYFYLWSLISMVLIFVFFIIIPLFFDKTVGMFFTRIKIVFHGKNKLVSIIKKELFFSISWIFIFLVIMTIINHTLFNRFALTNQEEISYSIWENFRISIVSTISSILIICQMIISISIIVKRGKRSLYEKYSNTTIVWINKEVEETTEKEDSDYKKLKPKLVTREIIEWV